MLVLGDLVGYGADPNAVIDHVRAMTGATIIRGNHDGKGSGLETLTASTIWPGHRLDGDGVDAAKSSLAGGHARRPALIDEVGDCHGSPFDEDAMIFDDLDARRAVNGDATGLPVGHTHVPAVFSDDGGLSSVGRRAARNTA